MMKAPEASKVFHDATGVEFGRRLKTAREKRGWTQTKVGEELAVSSQAVSQWETGKSVPSFDKIFFLAGLLGVSVDYLFGTEHTAVAGPSFSSKAPRSWRAPLLKSVEFAKLIYSNETVLDPETVFLTAFHKPKGHLLAMIIDDLSMKPEYNVGDHIIVDTELLPNPGDHVLVSLEDHGPPILRKWRSVRDVQNTGIAATHLVPDNQDYPIDIFDEKLGHKFIGTVVEHRRYRSIG